MMDRIEDETVRYLYFLRFEQNPGALPFANEDSEYEEDEEAEEQKRLEIARQVEEQQRLAAQSAVQDMTRGIQKRHERELKDLQLVGQNGSGTASQTVNNGGPKVGRNDPCPCGSGKKYKKCHGA
jgi:preprotein translocase subunit SecA